MLRALGMWLIWLLLNDGCWDYCAFHLGGPRTQRTHHAYAAPERRELSRIDTAVDATKTVDSLVTLVKSKAIAARGPTKALLYKYTKEPKLEP